MHISEQIISLISPTPCVGCGVEHTVLCIACSTSEILPFGERCWRCNSLTFAAKTCSSCRSFGGPTTVWITTEYQGLIKDIIKSYKYNHTRSLAPKIAELMSQTLNTFCPPALLARRDYLVVHVPTASSRARSRGFDHSKLIAKSVASINELGYADLLGRIGNSRQVGASREERLKQAKGQYYVKNPEKINGRNIILVDDVLTTGATLKECATILRKAGAKRVEALVFAKRL